MNQKQLNCNYPDCPAPHRRNGYCAKHSQRFKRGTLFTEKVERMCDEPGCNRKHYCKGFCVRHFQQKKRNDIAAKIRDVRTEFDTGNLNFTYTDPQSWSRAAKKFFGNKCMVCGWNEAPCDTHHIIEKSKGGPNCLQNAVVLCPNDHARAHAGKLTVEQLQEYNTKAIESKTQVVEPQGESN